MDKATFYCESQGRCSPCLHLALWLKRVDSKVREDSPIQVRIAAEDSRDGYFVQCHWMQAVSLPKCNAAYQKVRGEVSTFLQALLPLIASLPDRRL